jgi:hypothetical protein
MPDESEVAPDTIEVFVDPARFVGTGARILYRLRAGCTPGEILDEIAEALEIDAGEYRRLVLGVLSDVDGAGDFKL